MEINEIKCKYIEMNAYINNNCIDIVDINDFIKLIIDNNIETLYYGEKTFHEHKTKCFMFVLNSNIFTFSYQLDDGYYESIKDYMDANSGNFTSLYALNSAKKYGINNQEEYDSFEQKLFEENMNKQKYPIIGLIRKSDFNKTNKSAIAAVCGCDEEEVYNITVINERFEKKYRGDRPGFSTHGNKYNLIYDGRYIKKFIRKYDDYYFIFVDMTDKYIYNVRFAQYDNQKDFFDSFFKNRYSEYFSSEGCYLMKDTILLINEMKEEGYNNFYTSIDYKLLDAYAYDPRYIIKSVRYK
jgi:hypothetical protein